MNVQSAIHVEMVPAPTSLGVLNAIAMTALSQGPWWLVKASDTFLGHYLSLMEKGFLWRCFSFYLCCSDVLLMSIFITDIFSFTPMSIVSVATLQPLSGNSGSSQIRHRLTDCLFPWSWITSSWLSRMPVNCGLYLNIVNEIFWNQLYYTKESWCLCTIIKTACQACRSQWLRFVLSLSLSG